MNGENLEATTEAWRRYVESGRVTRELLRERTYFSWLRCRELGTDPHHFARAKLSAPETAALLRKEAALVEAARPFLVTLSQAAGADSHAALLSDAGGVVLEMAGDEETLAASQAGHFPGPGVLMSERSAGSNGIGTALAENDYVEVIGPEHFVEELRSFTCQGLPLRGPQSTVVGALAMTVRSMDVAERVREILLCAANGIETELTRHRIEELEGAVVNALGTREGASPLVDELCRDLACVHAGASQKLEAAAEMARANRPEDMRRLVLSMDALVERFKRQSALWREIAGDGVRPPQPIDLDRRVDEMVELLEAETTMRGIRVKVGQRSGMVAFVEPQTLSRRLFRIFLDALGAASRGTEITVDAWNTPRGFELAFSTGHELRLPRTDEDHDQA